MFDLQTKRAFILGTHFEKRMYNVYTGLQTLSRPPYLDDLLLEETSIQAALVLEKTRHLLRGDDKEIREFNELFNAVWQDDNSAKFEVLENLTADDRRDMIFDIYAFMEYNQMSYLTRDGRTQPVFSAKLVNAPSRAVW